MSVEFSAVAPYLRDPLVLIGFFLLLAFWFTRALLKQGIIPPLPAGRGYQVLRTILLYGFVIGLALIVLGFTLKYLEQRSIERQHQAEVEQRNQETKATQAEHEAARKEREAVADRIRKEHDQLELNALTLLRGELAANLRTTNELRKNLITLLGVIDSISTVIRTAGIRILPILFAADNLNPDAKVNAMEEAARAMDALALSGLDRDETERRKLAAAASAIVGTIDRTMSTVRSLGDTDGRRYAVSSQVWESNQAILREAKRIEVDKFQATYAATRGLRTNYDIVIARAIEYMEAVKEFFASPDHVIDRQRLTRVLAAEHLAVSLIAVYAKEATERIAEMRTIQNQLAKQQSAAGAGA